MFFVLLVLYVLPTIIAAWRDHRNGVAILIINVFLGWTLVGWVVALEWACDASRPRLGS